MHKMRAWQKEILQPLFDAHVDFLVGAVKTMEIDVRYLISNIPNLRANAVCHEVALNNLSEYRIETHNHHCGKEAEFMRNAANKGLSRDWICRYIWDLLEKRLSVDPDLEEIEEIPDLFEIILKCPFCYEIYFERSTIDECARGMWTGGMCDHYAGCDGRNGGDCTKVSEWMSEDDLNWYLTQISIDISKEWGEIVEITENDLRMTTNELAEEYPNTIVLADPDDDAEKVYIVEDKEDMIEWLLSKARAGIFFEEPDY